MSKKLFIPAFLTVNFILAAALTYHLYQKNSSKAPTKLEVKKSAPAKAVVSISAPSKPIAVPQPVKPATTSASQAVIAPVSMCTMFGPLGNQQKIMIDAIVKSTSLTQIATVYQKPFYEIFWNLGTDKVKAEELFLKQKNNGALKHERFKLVQEENSWIVLVTYMTSLESAKTASTQLAESGNKVNAGGNWQYRQKGDAYFYQFKDISKTPPSVISTIEQSIAPRQSCV